MRLPVAVGLASLLALPCHGDPGPIHPRVVVVTMFEVGADSGDVPGEFQYWVQREHLDRLLPLPAAYHGVRTNADGTVLGIVVGQGTSNAAASIMALGCDSRFDLSKSYWLVAGIAGISPSAGSIGSAAWAEYVVDGELAYEIDAREIPPGWPDGHVPLGADRPFQQPRPRDEFGSTIVYHLDPGLVDWAYTLTKDTPLPDNEKMKARRDAYVYHPAARRPPFVLKGDNLSSSTYWHGERMDAWATAWVKYHTGGRGSFATTAMEDSGTLRSLTYLSRAGRVDIRRVLVLRTASNYDMQWPGATAAQSMTGHDLGIYTAYIPSLEAAYRVGSRVVHALVAGWGQFENDPPQGPAPR
jgi:purine nucleoside permease